MHRNWSRHEKRLTSRCPSYLATSRRNVCSGRCCTSWVKTKRPCDMTASRSGLGPASGGDALESVTGKDRSNNDVKQPLTRLVVNFYRTVVACAKKPGAKKAHPAFAHGALHRVSGAGGIFREGILPPRKTPHIHVRRPAGLVRRLRRDGGAPEIKIHGNGNGTSRFTAASQIGRDNV